MKIKMDDDPSSQSLLFKILLLVILTLLNAFFAAAEMAIASLNRNRIEQKAEQGDKKATKLAKLIKEPSDFLATIQVAITLITLLQGASLADSLAKNLSVFLGGSEIAFQVSRVLSFLMLTYVSIVLGELYPKRIAMNKSEEVAKFVILPIQTVGFIAKPFVWLLSASTNLLSRITPMTFDDETTKMTRDEMRYMLENEGVLDSEELDMVQGVFSLDTKVARELMVPRTDAFMIDIQDSVQENIDVLLSENFSRIPVYREEKDKVVGILHMKNLLKAAHECGFDNLQIEKILQEPLFVPETIGVNDLLYEMKKTKNQMAILLDEYGGVVGLVTLEDLLEEIIGEIEDETDESEEEYQKIDEHSYLVQGKMLISDFNEVFEMNLQMNDVDTMAGYMITALGSIPNEDEKPSYNVDNLTLITEKMDGTRLLQLKAIFHPDIENEDDAKKEEKMVHEE